MNRCAYIVDYYIVLLLCITIYHFYLSEFFCNITKIHILFTTSGIFINYYLIKIAINLNDNFQSKYHSTVLS